MSESKQVIRLFLCSKTGESVACMEGIDIETLRECNVCRKFWRQPGCRVSRPNNTVLEFDQEVISVFGQIERLLSC